MKAVVLREYGGPDKLSYEDVADPKVGEGEVLVRVAATSVNPIDYKLRSGSYKAFMPLEFPAILGNDFSGIVREVGKGVSGFAPGDKVMGVADKSDAEMVVAKADALMLVPEGSGPGGGGGAARGDDDGGAVDLEGDWNPVGANGADHGSDGKRWSSRS